MLKLALIKISPIYLGRNSKYSPYVLNTLSYDFTVKNVYLRVMFYQDFFKGFEVICFVG